jgi:hypothetical protein
MNHFTFLLEDQFAVTEKSVTGHEHKPLILTFPHFLNFLTSLSGDAKLDNLSDGINGCFSKFQNFTHFGTITKYIPLDNTNRYNYNNNYLNLFVLSLN